jgi:hypothetical protein
MPAQGRWSVRPQVNPPTSAVVSIPAPVRGWIENDNLARNGGLGASVLENWFPTANGLRVRKGSLKKATIGAGKIVRSLMAYRSAGSSKVFAASDTDVYDITLFNASVVPTPVYTQRSSGRWSYVQMAIASSEYLVAVNGANLAMYYDGTSWNPLAATAIHSLSYNTLTQAFVTGGALTGATSGATGTIRGVFPDTPTTGLLKISSLTGTFANGETITGSSGGSAKANGTTSSASAITITGVDTSVLNFVWTHGSRLWFVEDGTTKAWYLPVSQIGGAAVSFDLGGVFQKGGKLLFGGAWSSDSGSGMGDRNVFVSDQGEVAVYEGTNPSDAAAFSLVGRYDLGRPVTTQTLRAGGDLLIATADGLTPMSQVVSKDPAALSSSSVTYPIEPAWQWTTRSNINVQPVQILKWQAEAMGIFGFPHRGVTETFVVNLTTGAWAKWTGLDVQSLALHGDMALYGDSNGSIYHIEGGGSDNGAPYVCRYAGLPEDFGSAAAHKVVAQARATFRALVPFTPRLSVATNYRKEFGPAPDVVLEDIEAALWDVGIWDQSRWDDNPLNEERHTAITHWRSIGRNGYAISPQVQITAGSTRKLDAELISIDLLYMVGGSVV